MEFFLLFLVFPFMYYCLNEKYDLRNFDDEIQLLTLENSIKKQAVCNDGYWCSNYYDCLARNGHFKTSNNIDDDFHVDIESWYNGVFNKNVSVNPVFHNWNHAALIYCSSDSWIGNKTTYLEGVHPVKKVQEKTKMEFRGKNIVFHVVKEIIDKFADKNRKSEIVMSGSSAGGIGLVQNIDWVDKVLSGMGIDYRLLGVIDSGILYSGVKPLQSDANKTLGDLWSYMLYQWGGILDADCENKYGPRGRFKCMFFEHYLEFVKTPLFFYQDLLDSAILGLYIGSKSKVDVKNNETQAKYLGYYVNYQLSLFYNVFQMQALDENSRAKIIDKPGRNGAFITSCLNHCSFTKDLFWKILIKETIETRISSHNLHHSFSSVVKNWFVGNRERKRMISTCISKTKMNCEVGCPADF